MTQQEKIYIEVDEEITTIIDRLHQVKGNDVVLIVPQHALLLQSVVNLKLLAQEAARHKKQITIMTRDEDGVAFATRAGITVQPYITKEDEMMAYNYEENPRQIKPEQVPKYAKEMMEEDVTQKPKPGLGTNTFFSEHSVSGIISKQHSNQITRMATNNNAEQVSNQVSKEQIDKTQFNQIQNPNTNLEQDVQAQQQYKQYAQMPSRVNQGQTPMSVTYDEYPSEALSNQVKTTNQQMAGNTHNNLSQQQVPNYYGVDNRTQDKEKTAITATNELNPLDEYEQTLRMQSDGVVSNKNNHYKQPITQSQQNLSHDNMLQEAERKKDDNMQMEALNKKNKSKKKKKKKKESQKVSDTTNNVLKGFIIGGIALVVAVLLVVFLPKTNLTITPKEINIDESLEMTAKVDQTIYDAERRLLPARLIEKDVTYTKSFDATGSGDVTAQKAQGKITIINEFSNANQPLVENTRFLSENGTLFRLVNSTTVPGMKDGEPGKIEVLVKADQPGEVGNIGPTKFTIPGFEGSPKHEKIYATSEKSMTGGGTGGKGVSLVTEEDIARAKMQMTKEMPKYVQDQISGLLRPENEVLLSEAIMTEELSSEASVAPGTMADQFMYEIVDHVKVIVFSEDDVLAILESNLDNKGQQYEADQIDVKIEYTNVVADFDKQTLEMKAHGRAGVVATVDVEGFQKSITGKKHDELLTIMEEDYGDQIEKITIESVVPGFPAFIANHISKFDFMTKITVEEIEPSVSE
jgi:hypothetical protein